MPYKNREQQLEQNLDEGRRLNSTLSLGHGTAGLVTSLSRKISGGFNSRMARVMCGQNGLYQYGYTAPKKTTTTVTETFYDEEGRVTKEVTTETIVEGGGYTYPYQTYTTNDIKFNNGTKFDYSITYDDGSSNEV
jgi:hypothetical protein